MPFNSSDVISADIPHGLPGARSAARAFPCKRCTPRKVSSLFPWVSSCYTRWNQASPAPPPSPAGFTLVSAAYFSPLWQNCLARVNGRACAWNACEAWQESVWGWICVCVCLACTPWVTIHTLLCPCLRAKRRTNRSREMAICRRNERTFRSGSRWWYIFRQEVSWIFFVDFFILIYSGLRIAMRWFVWNRA